jgi:hypothetical protein
MSHIRLNKSNTNQETQLEKSNGNSGAVGALRDIGRIEIGLPPNSASSSANLQAHMEDQVDDGSMITGSTDPWALTDLVDTSEKWSGNAIFFCFLVIY